MLGFAPASDASSWATVAVVAGPRPGRSKSTRESRAAANTPLATKTPTSARPNGLGRREGGFGKRGGPPIM